MTRRNPSRPQCSQLTALMTHPAVRTRPASAGGHGSLLALLAVALIWWLFWRQPTPEAQTAAPANDVAAFSNASNAGAMANVSANVGDIASAPAEGTVDDPDRRWRDGREPGRQTRGKGLFRHRQG